MGVLCLGWVVQDIFKGTARLDFLVGLEFDHGVDHFVLLYSVPG